MLVGDGHALQAIDFLDFVHQIGLQFLFAEHGQDVVRVKRAIHERFACLDALALLHVDVHAPRDRVFLLRAVIGLHIEFALTLGDLTELDRAIDFADDRGLMRLTGLEELDHTRQTTGDVLGASGFPRDLGQNISWIYRVAFLHHQVRA